LRSTIFLASLLASCGTEFSPWQNDAPATNLTQKHLEKLEHKTGSFTVAITGDSQAVYGDFAKTITRINSRTDVDFTLLAGDITDRGLLKEFKLAVDIIQRAHKPVLTVVGNHDGLSYGKDLYRDTFGDLNYSFDYGGYRFVAWNNNNYEWDVDVGWLEERVASHSKVVVFSHQPPDQHSLIPEISERWAKVRKSSNLKASVHGHTHSHNFYREGNLPVYTVERVLGGSYGLMKFEDGRISFYDCQSVCAEVGK
jgi:3',5'-cyclic-AMP phosphodiesterase